MNNILGAKQNFLYFFIKENTYDSMVDYIKPFVNLGSIQHTKFMNLGEFDTLSTLA